MRIGPLAIVVCALGAGCYAPSVSEGVPCGLGDACPTGLVCDRGLCVRSPRPVDASTIADAAPDARIDAAPDAAPDAAVPLCGSTVLVDDDLDDAVPGPRFTSGAGAGMTVTEASGHLDISFAASVTAPSYGYYLSASTYPAAGLCATVEITRVADGDALTYLKLSSGTSEVEFVATNGTISLRTTNPTLVTHAQLPADLGTHRFWRLRQQGGVTYWDTAPDGIAYVEQLSVTGAFTPSTATIELGAGAYIDVANAGSARFERVTVQGLTGVRHQFTSPAGGTPLHDW